MKLKIITEMVTSGAVGTNVISAAIGSIVRRNNLQGFSGMIPFEYLVKKKRKKSEKNPKRN
jgi:hypothetical protein